MRAFSFRFAFLALVLPGCFFGDDDHNAHEGRPEETTEAVRALRWKVDLEPALSEIAGGDCQVSVAEGVVNVRVTPGARGAPDDAALRRMSNLIQDVTWIPPARQIIRTTSGKLLFTNGEPTR